MKIQILRKLCLYRALKLWPERMYPGNHSDPWHFPGSQFIDEHVCALLATRRHQCGVNIFSWLLWGNISAWYGLLQLLSSSSSSFTSAFGTTTFSFQNYPTSLFLALPRYALLRDLRCLCWAMLHIYMHMMHIYAAYNLCLVISFFWSKQGHLIFLKVSKTVSF